MFVNFEGLKKLDFKSNEAYKQLRTNIQFCGNDIKIICLTSCLPNEGKSNVSFHLSIAFAESGKQVLFLDADLRRSVIIGRYKPDHAVMGLTHYLSGQKELQEVLYETSVDNLDIIFTGPVPPNPAELLGSDCFCDLLKLLGEAYDYIIIDTPPLGSVIDGAIVAKYCDGVIFVIEADAISYKLAQKVKQQLEKSNCRILGAVLNKVEAKTAQYQYISRKYRKYDQKYYAID